MPGIAGIISHQSPDLCRHRLTAMLRTMLHEPSYESGTCEAPEMGVYAGWVAHRGSFAATESGTSVGNGCSLVFAGECFEDNDEPLLTRYERCRNTWPQALNGLFSGVIVDRRRARALLFNDRYGLERLYVHESTHATYFASEAKALLRVLPAARYFDEDGVAQFLTFGCTLDDRTLFRSIRTLDGGSLWTFADSSCRKQRYFSPTEWERQPGLDAEEFQSAFQDTFAKVLPRYVCDDASLGISLTGGLDTRMIMACLPARTSKPICYTFAGTEGRTVDADLARRVADVCGFDHRLLRIGPDFFSEYSRYVDRTVYITDGCAGPLAAHEIYLNAKARSIRDVRLTGNFGSEVLRSMSTLKTVGLAPEIIAPGFRARIAAVTLPPEDGRASVTFAAFREIPRKLFGLMASAKSQVTFRTPYLDNDLVALAYRAPTNVRRSSGSALRLIQNARPRLAAIPTDRAVIADGHGLIYLLKRFAAEASFKLEYFHKEAPQRVFTGLPAMAVLERLRLVRPHKYLPYRLWFRSDLATYLASALNDAAARHLPFWDEHALARIARDHVNGNRNYVREIDAVLTLGALDRLLLCTQ